MSPTAETYGLVNEIVARWHTDVSCADALDSLADASFIHMCFTVQKELSQNLTKLT
jgi:hypothetical protein